MIECGGTHHSTACGRRYGRHPRRHRASGRRPRSTVRARRRRSDYRLARPVARAQTVVLAVPFDSIDSLVPAFADRLAPETVVIDVVVPLTFAGGKMSV